MICPRCGSTQTTTAINTQGCITDLDCTNCDSELYRAGPHSAWYPLNHPHGVPDSHVTSTYAHTTKEAQYAMSKM